MIHYKTVTIGLYIYSKAIYSDAIKKVFSSKGQALFDKIKASSTYQNYHFDNNSNQFISAEKALADIIFNHLYADTRDHVYGYLLICICDILGKELPFTQDLKLGYETELVTRYLEIDFGTKDLGIENYLFNETFETGLPKIKEFPSIGLVPYVKLHILIDKLPTITLAEGTRSILG